MPPDLAEQVPLVHEACEALGVPILTSERFEADDVIGTLATQARDAGFEVALVTGDKDFFQLVGDGVRVFNPRDDGTWYDAAGVVDEVRRAARPGRGRAGADGRQRRQHQGRARHRRKGRARADRHARHARSPCSKRPPALPQKRYREALLAHADSARVEPRAGAHPHGRAGHVRRGGAALPRPVARTLLRAVLDARVPVADAGVRADRRVRARATTPWRRRSNDVDAHRRRAIARGRRDRPRAHRHAASRPCAPRSSAWRSRRAAGVGAVRADRPHGPDGSAQPARAPRCSTRLRAVLERRRHRARSATT